MFYGLIFQSHSKLALTLYCITSQNGRTRFKNLTLKTARFLKCVTILGRYALKDKLSLSAHSSPVLLQRSIVDPVFSYHFAVPQKMLRNLRKYYYEYA